ncbi:FMP52 Protein FMP52 [Candida maltosa Xu316]|uniref:NAD(P)-binding domain-containing protein n=1 Tax=Candida maltosa (strain Xu316) TaxID=1245528 RepID=M3HQ99_CANMX|nr:hypothetical protein G210_5549 [Candida maltosa Xu316]
MSTLIIGATGLVGSEIVKFADTSSTLTDVKILTRRPPTIESTEIKVIENADSLNWSETIKNNPTEVLISAFGTTRGQAGSAENFKKIDYGINYNAAKTAKENGTKIYVLVSALGASSKSHFLYMKTKGELEDDVIALGFDHTIILRPAILLGKRGASKGFGNDLAQTVGNWTKNTFLQRFLNSVEASDVAKVAVDLASKGVKGELKEKVQIIDSAEIIKLAANL